MPNATTRLKTLISEPSTVFENRILYSFSCPAELKVKGKKTLINIRTYIFSVHFVQRVYQIIRVKMFLRNNEKNSENRDVHEVFGLNKGSRQNVSVPHSHTCYTACSQYPLSSIAGYMSTEAMAYQMHSTIHGFRSFL